MGHGSSPLVTQILFSLVLMGLIYFLSTRATVVCSLLSTQASVPPVRRRYGVEYARRLHVSDE
jgi:hypothetical protein